MSWAPFVGVFIARISRGRTVREFVAGVLLVPTLLTRDWSAPMRPERRRWTRTGRCSACSTACQAARTMVRIQRRLQRQEFTEHVTKSLIDDGLVEPGDQRADSTPPR